MKRFAHYLRMTLLPGLMFIYFFPTVVLAEDPTRIVMTGDIMLAREVGREIRIKKSQSPWIGMQDFFANADWVMGNFEASIANTHDCPPNDSLCFVVAQDALSYPRQAGFTAMGIENNHSADAGKDARTLTRAALLDAGLLALDYEHSPGFFKSKDKVIAFIALSNVADKYGFKIDIPSTELRQKIRLAKSLSDWLVISIHWGAELSDWPQPKQRTMATWLIEQGVDVIVGHHPHVVQAAECILGKPVFFSLGNHVFDQKYPQTKQGLIADCKIASDVLSCAGVATQTPTNSAFPTLIDSVDSNALGACSVKKSQPMIIDDYKIRPKLGEHQFVDGDIILEGKKNNTHWTVVAKHLLSAEKASFIHEGRVQDFLVTLETHHSSIDQEMGPRPYVYQITPRGLVAKWRGSALAWPLVDAAIIRTGKVDYLCALHRKDSFVTLNPDTKATRTAVYQWNGFGFSGVEIPDVHAQCEQVFK